jgi:hypothetical protein
MAETPTSQFAASLEAMVSQLLAMGADPQLLAEQLLVDGAAIMVLHCGGHADAAQALNVIADHLEAKLAGAN